MDFEEPSTSSGIKRSTVSNESHSKRPNRQKMAPAIESQYKDLLNPIKDPEKSFSIDISQLLMSFLNGVYTGETPVNFNSAALLLQGSASVYAKKVEYLHNLASQLHTCLRKKNEQQKDQSKKDTPKEREKKEDKLNDPFLSTEIKMGKNLSCLKKKNTPKAQSKKTTKKVKISNAPVHLLTHDNDEKGEVFYDTRGEIVGNKGDFAMNKCRLISSGWLLLPTVNPNIVPSLETVPDYYDDYDNSPPGTEIQETGDDFDPIEGSPDDGFGSCPPSSDIPPTEPGTEIDSQGTDMNSSAVPMSVDEGIGDTPNLDDSPGAENVPADEGEVDQPAVPQVVRQPAREALRTCQLAVEDDPLAGIAINKELLKKKAIQKKNVRRLPNKLKDNMPPSPTESITLYCARTFFSLDDKLLHHSLLSFDTESFDQNSHFLKRISEKIQALKTSDKRNKNIAPIEDEREIDVEGLEVSRDANEDDESLCVPFDDNDIQIEHDPMALVDLPQKLTLPEGDHVDQVPAPDIPSPDISHLAQEERTNYINELQQFVQNSDISERVHEWEKSVKPFLDEMEQRGSFDINMYGSQILNSFEDTNRKQTKTFRELCKDMEKWEIHRYFMAVLPLANIGNVELGKEKKPDGTEEIYVTLLSRKMHHKELEEFGHAEGEHS